MDRYTCPSCGNGPMVPHCTIHPYRIRDDDRAHGGTPSHTCDLTVCTSCGSFGERQVEGRWCNMQDATP